MPTPRTNIKSRKLFLKACIQRNIDSSVDTLHPRLVTHKNNNTMLIVHAKMNEKYLSKWHDLLHYNICFRFYDKVPVLFRLGVFYLRFSFRDISYFTFLVLLSLWCSICFLLMQKYFSRRSKNVFAGRSIPLSAAETQPIPYKANRMKRHKNIVFGIPKTHKCIVQMPGPSQT